MRALKWRDRGSGGEIRRDPAPSRLKYRLQRWMLTPGIRLGLRVGVPICLIAAACGAYLADEGRRDTLQGLINEARAAVEERPEFMVNMMAIDGAGTSVAEDIREVVGLDFPVSSFDLDLEQVRGMITGLDPVKSARVRIRPGGVLQVDVEEREPAVVWRSREGLALLDETGTHVAELGRRSLHPDLPLVAGKGADRHVGEALRLLAAARPLGGRLRGLVRVGERRWDVVLDRGQRILLPARNPLPALERVIAVSEVQDLLERDVAAVDMRIAARPTVRMTENAVENWWRIRQLNGGGQ
ncbi:cell division protein FtsQ/DivIB [Roseobacteraceae bacterium NS-SX3]